MTKDRNSWGRHSAISQNSAENQKISELIRKHEMANQRIESLMSELEELLKKSA